MTIAQVVPALALPRSLAWFDYRIPAALAGRLAPGAVVRIPFRQRVCLGVVWQLTDRPTVPLGKIKTLITVDRSRVLLNDRQRSLFDWLAARYGVARGLLIKAFLTPALLPALPSAEPEAQPAVRRADELASQPVGPGLNLFVYDRRDGRDRFLARLLNHRGTAPSLVVTPELSRLAAIRSAFPQAAVLTTQQTIRERRQGLRRLGSAPVIVGTRSVLLLPLPRLRQLILDEEDSEQHKSRDQQPRSHSLRLALAWAERYDCPVIALSPAPSLAAYGERVQRGRSWVRLRDPRPVAVELLESFPSRSAERRLQTAILELTRNQLRDERRLIIFLNRRGWYRLVACEECGWLARCDRCATTLARHPDGLRCHACGLRSVGPNVCPRCGSAKLASLLPGTAGWERLLDRHFPGQIGRLDRDRFDLTALKKPVVIGTEVALPWLQRFGPQEALVLGIDQVFTRPESRALERAMQLLRRLAMADQLERLTIVTRFPTHPLFQNFARGDLESFYASEWRRRHEHQLPPAWPSVIFEARGDRQRAERELRVWLKASQLDPAALHGPIEVQRRSTRTIQYRLTNAPDPLPRLTALPESWIIDPDPLE